MTGRERVQRSLDYNHPNGLIVEGGFSPATWLRYREALEPLYRRLPDDFQLHDQPYGKYDDMRPDFRQGNVYVDAWGCRWECLVNGMQGIIKRHPLTDWADFDSYRLPDPATTADCEAGFDIAAYREGCKRRADQGVYIMGGSGERLWERAHFLRGYENIMVDLGMEEENLPRLIEKIVQYNIDNTEKYLAIDEIDCICFQDDWGEQNRLMISPTMWREYFFDGYRRMFRTVHSAGKKVYFHTDGYLLDIIGDFTEAGADIINVQAACQTLEQLKQARADRVCISVDIDRQFTMPYATPEGMKQHVRDIYTALDGARGGLWCKMDVYPDVPLENIEAMIEVFEELRA